LFRRLALFFPSIPHTRAQVRQNGGGEGFIG
jgi:hypothetical protein